MIDTPSWLSLPSGSTLIEDPDEEIFLLYTRKQQIRAAAIDANEPSAASEGGLGFHSAKDEVLSLELVVTNPWMAPGQKPSGGKGKGNRKGKEKEEVEVTVEIELHQSLDALRNRRGDTGSVLWRISLHLANYLLRAHHFPHPSYPPLLPHLSTSTVLELGSGTGALGLALRSLLSSSSSSSSSSDSPRIASTGKWIFTDQLSNLPLVLRNLRANGIRDAQIGDKPSQPFEVVELDWLVESAEWLKSPRPLYSTFSSEPSHARTQGLLAAAPSLILAVDCIYNPSLSAPLAHTILRHSGPETVVLVASELRDEEPLEVFLRVWMEEGGGKGWRFARLGWAGEEERMAGRLAEAQYVVWVGWREENEESRN